MEEDSEWKQVHSIVAGARRVADELRNLGHGAEAQHQLPIAMNAERRSPYSNDALDGEVCLVGERAGEVVGADLVGRDERVGDQELRPLVQETELYAKCQLRPPDPTVITYVGLQLREISGLLRVAQRHDDHIPTLCAARVRYAADQDVGSTFNRHGLI